MKRILLSLLATFTILLRSDSGADVIYVAEEQSLRVSIVDSNGDVHPFATNLSLVYGLALDSRDILYVAGVGDDTIRRVTPAGVSTYASGPTLGSPVGL